MRSEIKVAGSPRYHPPGIRYHRLFTLSPHNTHINFRRDGHRIPSNRGRPGYGTYYPLRRREGGLKETQYENSDENYASTGYDTSTASLTSSINNYLNENGRRYHQYYGADKNLQPNDEVTFSSLRLWKWRKGG